MIKRLSMTEDEAMHILGYSNKTGRYKFSDYAKWKEALDKRIQYRDQFRFNQYARKIILIKKMFHYIGISQGFSILVRPNTKTDID